MFGSRAQADTSPSKNYAVEIPSIVYYRRPMLSVVTIYRRSTFFSRVALSTPPLPRGESVHDLKGSAHLSSSRSHASIGGNQIFSRKKMHLPGIDPSYLHPENKNLEMCLVRFSSSVFPRAQLVSSGTRVWVSQPQYTDRGRNTAGRSSEQSPEFYISPAGVLSSPSTIVSRTRSCPCVQYFPTV